MYIAEAHARDEWPIGEQLSFTQHRTNDERLAVAKEFALVSKCTIPMAVDTVRNELMDSFAAWPTRAFIVRRGRLEYVAHVRVLAAENKDAPGCAGGCVGEYNFDFRELGDRLRREAARAGRALSVSANDTPSAAVSVSACAQANSCIEAIVKRDL